MPGSADKFGNDLFEFCGLERHRFSIPPWRFRAPTGSVKQCPPALHLSPPTPLPMRIEGTKSYVATEALKVAVNAVAAARSTAFLHLAFLLCSDSRHRLGACASGRAAGSFKFRPYKRVGSWLPNCGGGAAPAPGPRTWRPRRLPGAAPRTGPRKRPMASANIRDHSRLAGRIPAGPSRLARPSPPCFSRSELTFTLRQSMRFEGTTILCRDRGSQGRGQCGGHAAAAAAGQGRARHRQDHPRPRDRRRRSARR